MLDLGKRGADRGSKNQFQVSKRLIAAELSDFTSPRHGSKTVAAKVISCATAAI